jgi:hypothetical protein
MDQEIVAYCRGPYCVLSVQVDLPVAPAVMVGNEIIVEGTDVSERDVEACICRLFGLPEPEPPKKWQ